MIITTRQSTGTYRTDREFLEIITELQTEYMSNPDEQAVYGKLLEILLAVTGSGHGFIAEMISDVSDTPLLRICARSSSSADAQSPANENGYVDLNLIEPGPIGDGIFGKSIRARNVVILNDIESTIEVGWLDQALQGDLNSAMCIPILSRSEVLALVGLGNRPGGYSDSLLDYIEPMIATLSGVARSQRLFRERALARRHLMSEKEVAEKANQAKSDFLSSVSHDLRTPLNAILGFSEMLKAEVYGDLGSERNREYANLINTSGNALLKMVDRLLDLENLEEGAIVVTNRDVDLRKTIDNLSGTLREDLKDTGITLDIEIPNQPIVMTADPEGISIILQNLVSNAAKFSPPNGTVQITVEVSPGDGLTISVIDHGEGFSESALENFGMPFSADDAYLADTRRGIGLGLAMSKRYAELMGGELDLLTAPGKGATVFVKFPQEIVVG